MSYPKRRFQGFHKPWRFVRLADAAASFDYGVNVAAGPFDGTHGYIRITDIDDKTRKYLASAGKSPVQVPQEQYLVGQDDILFARTGTSTGKTYLYDKSDGKLYFSGFLIRAHIKDGYNSRFVFSQTLTQTYKKWVAVMSVRSGQPGINLREYMRYGFYVPERAEQDKIAQTIFLLDKKIELQQERAKLLRRYKQGLLQICFFNKSEDKRQRWNSAKVREILPQRAHRGVAGLELLSVTKESGVKKRSELGAMDVSSLDKRRYKLAMPGDIVCNSMRMWQGACGVSPYKGIVSPAYTVLIPSEQIDARWIVQLFKTKKMQNLFKRYSQGLTDDAWTLKYTQIADIQLHFPSFEEQRKMADMLEKADRAVTLCEEKIDCLYSYKQALLQQILL